MSCKRVCIEIVDEGLQQQKALALHNQLLSYLSLVVELNHHPLDAHSVRNLSSLRPTSFYAMPHINWMTRQKKYLLGRVRIKRHPSSSSRGGYSELVCRKPSRVIFPSSMSLAAAEKSKHTRARQVKESFVAHRFRRRRPQRADKTRYIISYQRIC